MDFDLQMYAAHTKALATLVSNVQFIFFQNLRWLLHAAVCNSAWSSNCAQNIYDKCATDDSEIQRWIKMLWRFTRDVLGVL